MAVAVSINHLPHWFRINSPILDRESTHWVHVTHVNHPNDFYIRPLIYKQQLELIECAESDENIYPEIGTLVLFKSKANNWIRGKVLSGDKDRYEIFAMDYGFCELNVLMENIKKLSAQSATIPELTIKASTIWCEPLCDLLTATSAMKEYLENKAAKVKVKGVDEFNKVFVTIIYPEDISFIFAFSNLCTLGNTINTVRPNPVLASYPERDMNIGDILHVTFLHEEHSGKFYVTLTQDYAESLYKNQSFTKFARRCRKKLEAKELMAGCPVCYHHDLEAYRAIITKVVNSDKVQIMLVDQGITRDTSWTNLSKIDEFALRDPPMAMYCYVSNVRDARKYFYPGMQFNITMQEVGKQFSLAHKVHIANNKNTVFY